MEHQERPPRIWIFVVVALTAALSSLGTAVYFLKYYEAPALAPLAEMADTIEKEYYFADEKTSEDQLVDHALRGMIGGIGDVYADYMTSEEYDELLTEDAGEYKGIGISIEAPTERGSLVWKIYNGSPADEAGVKAGDVIINVNGSDTKNLSMADYLKLFHDGEDETDTLTLLRAANGEVYTVTLAKREIKVPRVFFERLADGKGYIRIEEFEGNVVAEFQTAIDTLISAGADALIIDLRNNPGGGLGEVLGTVDCILNEGTLIATVRNRSGEETVYKAETKGIDLPIAVLVNGNSASGSEMFSGAMKDNGRAKIIGTQTFGKGIVQSYYRLRSNGGWVKLTTDAYYTPGGVCIHETGITPDIAVELPDEDGDGYVDISALDHAEDPQLRAAIQELNQND